MNAVRQLVVESSLRIQKERLPSELQKLEHQFKAGEVDVIRIFTARTSLIQNHRAHLDTLNELAQAAWPTHRSDRDSTASGGVGRAVSESRFRVPESTLSNARYCSPVQVLVMPQSPH